MKKNQFTPNSPESDESQTIDLNEFQKSTFSEWKDAAIQGLKGAPFEKVLKRKTLDGIILDAIYDDVPEIISSDSINDLIRGATQVGGWGIGQIFQCNRPESFAMHLKNALTTGQNEVRFVLANPHRRQPAEGEEIIESLYDIGVEVTELSHLHIALPDIVRGVVTRFHCGSSGISTLAMWAALHHQRGWKMTEWRGSLGYSPISELATAGELPGTASRVFDEAHALVQWGKENAPDAGMLLVDGSAYHNGGAGAALELACCLGEVSVYLNELASRGGSVDDVTCRLSIQLATGDDFFEDVAKMRALRLLFAGLTRILGATRLSSPEIWSRTSRLWAVKDEPLNNILRSITATMSAVFGGAVNIHSAPFNEIISETDDFAARISRNVQLILQDECQLGDVGDPCGGAYYVEHLTEKLAEKAWELLGQMTSHPDGFLGGLSDGSVAKMVETSHAQRMEKLNRRKQKMVGVNDFVAFDAVDDAIKVASSFRGGSAGESERGVSADVAPEWHENIIEGAISAALNGATLRGIDASVKGVGVWRVPAVIGSRLASGYEQLRRQVALVNARRQNECSVLLLRLGTIRDARARADFSRGFFNAAGFRIVESPFCNGVEDAVAAVRSARADITVFCSTDELYAQKAPPIAEAIRADSETTMVLAGRPLEMESTYRQSGISEFIFLGANHFSLLKSLLETVGGHHD
jgi:methylmalonyl-CoA mutase